MCGLSKPGQWEIAQALYVLGSICELRVSVCADDPAANVVGAFYAATYPGIVRDLPKVVQSEEDVRAGRKL